MTHLTTLLKTREGRNYLTLVLLDAFYDNKEILYSIQDKDSDRAEACILVQKSRNTEHGWLFIERPPQSFIDSLPHTMEVSETVLNEKLEELVHLRKRVTELQQHSTEQLEEVRKMKHLLRPNPNGDVLLVSQRPHSAYKALEDEVASLKEVIGTQERDIQLLKNDMMRERRFNAELRQENTELREQLKPYPGYKSDRLKIAEASVSDLQRDLLNTQEELHRIKRERDDLQIEVGNLRASGREEDKDFGEQFAELVARGLTDREILERFSEDDMELLVGLIRKLMEKDDG